MSALPYSGGGKMEQLISTANYQLKMTEEYFRYYYDSKRIIHIKTTHYDIEKDLELPTSVASIKIKDISYVENSIWSIFVEFTNDDFDRETVEISRDTPQTIFLTEGNPDVSRTSKCTLEIVKK